MTTASATLPSGSLRDSGQAYGERTGADQGTGLSFGWVTTGTTTPLDLSGYGRLRSNTAVSDKRQLSFVHMQPSSKSGSWEIAVPVGFYQVTVGVGDAGPYYDSLHAAAVEDVQAVAPYTPTSSVRLRTATVTVQVSDGRLTVAPTGGSNVKLTFVAVAQAPALLPVRVDFGTSKSVPPAGWRLDTGEPYGGGYPAAGWVGPGTSVPRDLRPYARQRSTSGQTDPRIRNFIHMQYSSDTSLWGSWEVALPAGRYTVTVAVGDSDATYDSVHQVSAEGVRVVGPFKPSSGTRSATGSAQVEVADGRLTLNATGTNTKIEWVEIDDPIPGEEPPPPDPVRVDFGAKSTVPASGYRLDYGEPFAERPTGGSWGWVKDGTSTPLDLTLNGRQRSSTDPDVRLKSFLHMQYSGTSGTTTPGAWELALPSGTYQLQVGVGDPSALDSVHAIVAEGVTAIASFKPVSGRRFASASVTVPVTDGRLTLRPTGGTNTKITFAVVTPIDPDRPRIATATPADGSTNVFRDTPVTAEVVLPHGALDPSTVTSASVKLIAVATGATIAASVNTSGGGDVVVLSPTVPLAALTQYLFQVDEGVHDITGRSMQAFSTTFTTGSASQGQGIEGVAFTKGSSGASARDWTSLVIGPDHRLYAATLDGTLGRWNIAPDGSLSNERLITTVRDLNAGARRTVIGLAFEPGSTAAAPRLWVSDNAPWSGTNDVADWTDSLDLLTGPDLGTGRKVVVGLPRSAHDHMTNSLAFGPDGGLYVSQGSNSGMGDPDAAWAGRPEHLLTASILRVNTAALPATGALDVRTDDAGSYDPAAPGAAVTLWATGIRNAYDLVWHSNGELYAPMNGSASGSNIPATPTPLPPACSTTRPDLATSGPYTYQGPASTAIAYNPKAQTDFVLRVHKGGYYGHPNPTRCEFVSRGGNPTSGVDPFEEPSYPVGVRPDRNFRVGDIVDAGEHASADGAIEYRSASFGGKLTGKLLVVRYSAGKDVMVMDPSGTGGAITSTATGITGLTGFDDPVDLAEDPATGALYISELGGRSITLARPAA